MNLIERLRTGVEYINSSLFGIVCKEPDIDSAEKSMNDAADLLEEIRQRIYDNQNADMPRITGMLYWLEAKLEGK